VRQRQKLCGRGKRKKEQERKEIETIKIYKWERYLERCEAKTKAMREREEKERPREKEKLFFFLFHPSAISRRPLLTNGKGTI
jgi:hypothetical protein